MIKRKHRKLPHEVFEMLESASKVDDRIQILRENQTKEITIILQCAFDKNIVFELPTGAPPYTVDNAPPGLQITPLHKHIDRLINCVKGKTKYPGDNRLNILKRESIFVKVLEIAHAKDAEILIAMKDKKLSKLYPSLKESLVRKAFPTLLPPKL